ncbi:YbjQ family protein [Pontibacter sp. G13]|uniref:YbjQ family protein n=1 Tax=Pontibacter sp. G13 TaxID=3074898 RepID=UPI00288AA198|nr:YbjQ family protein [Pontibacter sp. G13]WNJ16328.1 YbjQ family protein [Pontibacter sp. G13]
MLVVNTPNLPGYRVKQVYGLVKGNTTRARFIGRDIIAGFKMIAGGEISEYTELLMDARDQALDQMVEEAEKLGANAILNVRFTTSAIAQGASEILVFGTAVAVEQEHM